MRLSVAQTKNVKTVMQWEPRRHLLAWFEDHQELEYFVEMYFRSRGECTDVQSTCQTQWKTWGVLHKLGVCLSVVVEVGGRISASSRLAGLQHNLTFSDTIHRKQHTDTMYKLMQTH